MNLQSHEPMNRRNTITKLRELADQIHRSYGNDAIYDGVKIARYPFPDEDHAALYQAQSAVDKAINHLHAAADRLTRMTPAEPSERELDTLLQLPATREVLAQLRTLVREFPEYLKDPRFTEWVINNRELF